MIVALIGPSGAGKSTVARRLDAAGVVWVVPSFTTRPPRPEERWGSVDHRFCSEDEFNAMLSAGRFAATGSLPGLSYQYGLPTLPKRPSRPFLVVCRAGNVEAVRRLGLRTIVYVVEASAEECGRRVTSRGGAPAELAVRTRYHVSEVAVGRCLADRTFRSDTSPDDLADAVAAAIRMDWKEGS